MVDPAGNALLSLSGRQFSKNAYHAAFVKAVETNTPVFTDIHLDAQGNMPHFSVIAPVFGEKENSGRVLGAVGFLIRVSRTVYPRIEFLSAPAKSLETLLIRSENDLLRYLSTPRHQKAEPMEMTVPVNRKDAPEVKAAMGHEGFGRGVDYRGTEVVFASFPVNKSPWFIVTKMDVSEAFADWRIRSMLLLAAILGLGTAIGFIGLVLWQRDRKTYYQALYLSESELRESMERHSITLKAIGDAVIVTDAGGMVEMLNPAAETLTGWTDKEARTRPLQEVFHIVNEQTGERVEDPAAKVLRRGGVVDLANHTLLIAKDGTRRPVADSGAPIYSQKNEIIGVVIVFRDQSGDLLESRKTELRLELIEYAAGHTLDELLTHALDRIGEVVESPIGFYHFVSDDQQTLFLQQWSSRTLNEFCGIDKGRGEHYPLRAAGIWAECARSGKPVVHNDCEAMEKKTELPEGHARVIRQIVVPVIRKNRTVAIVGLGNKAEKYSEKDAEIVSYLADVTWEIVERKKAEAERENLLSAIEQAGEMIVVTDIAGAIEYVNPAFEKKTGYSREEAVGKNPRILKSGKQDESFYKDLWETISAGKIWHGRMVNKCRDGSLYTEDATISPVWGYSGQIVNYVAVKHDITDQLRLEAQFRQAQKMESVGRMAGGVAHDYNNMLSIIMGYAELVIDKTDDASIRSDIAEILNAGKRSSEITRQLLAFARKQSVSPVVLDLNKTIEGMLKMLGRLIGEDIDIAWNPCEKPGFVKLDPAQVDQILANLCVNARDAISGVGKLTIETANVFLDEAYCAHNAGFVPGNYVLLAVSDNGSGMDQQTLENIFDPFFTTKDSHEGTGLGLSTVYGIVKQNGGFINVYSEQGCGTTFRIYLPVCGEGVENLNAPAVDENPKGNKETVLVVEDDASTLKIAARTLDSLGYAVLEAAGAGEAMDLADGYDGDIHLLMTDVIMPGINGRELAEKIQSARPGIKCLYMSGYTFDVIKHRGMLGRNERLVQKPFSIRDLAHRVREALDEAK